MPSLSEKYILKAEGDYATAMREYRARKLPNYDAACFHAQQCIEKYLKARLLEYECLWFAMDSLRSAGINIKHSN